MKSMIFAALTLISVAACTPYEGAYDNTSAGDGYSNEY